MVCNLSVLTSGSPTRMADNLSVDHLRDVTLVMGLPVGYKQIQVRVHWLYSSARRGAGL